MINIIPAISSVAGICGKQKQLSNHEYRLSKHCISASCDDGELLYHTLTGSLLLLSDHETVEDNYENLINDWFLVPATFDENKHTDEVKRIVRMMQSPVREKTDFTILTTTDCNARCFYCYELGIKRFFMKKKIAYDTAQYISQVSRGKQVKILWMGGEPLYNKEAIETICNELANRGIPYESKMISNGYYLDEETAKNASDYWNLKKVQITIDGTERIYNETKAYTDADKNPYLRIMSNIQTALSAGITVTIRLNMDKRNAKNLLQLIDEIKERFDRYNNLEVYVAMIHEFKSSIHKYPTQDQAAEDYKTIRNKLAKLGLLRLKKLTQSVRIFKCMADNDVSETIMPDGRIGRCQHYNDSIFTGNIYCDERDHNVEKQWKTQLAVPECADCVLYPQCTKLQMCEWNQNGCSELDRKIQIYELKQQMLAAYYDYKNGGEQH